MFKAIEEVRKALLRHFNTHWSDEVADEALWIASRRWPCVVSLGSVKTSELTSSALEVSDYVRSLREWCERKGLELVESPRRFGAVQSLPSRVIAPTIDASAEVAGIWYVDLLAMARRRVRLLASEEGLPKVFRDDANALSRALVFTRGWEDEDFKLLIRAGVWFAHHDASGLTPRQVPLEGFHAKWLDARGTRELVCLLAGKESINLADRPFEVSFAYLDPAWLSQGGRHYDTYVQGDVAALPYDPRFVLVVENKDTYLAFPPVEGGVCVFGKGKEGPARLGLVPWVREARTVFYWGDMDADGLEILNAYRAAGLEVESILMDLPSFEAYERFGTRQKARVRDLAAHVPQSVPNLVADERALYERLTDPSWKGALRIEQERIPLEVAVNEISDRLQAAESLLDGPIGKI